MQSDEFERIAQVARLYLIVNGRPPDPGGLAAYVQHMQDGRTLRQLAGEFIAGGEFTNRLNGKDPAHVLHHTVFGDTADLASLANLPTDLAELVTTLILSPDAQKRLPLLPALYPAGVLLENPHDYRIWLAEKQQQTITAPLDPISRPTPRLSFIVQLQRPKIAWLMNMIASVLDQASPQVELLIVARERFPKAVRQRATADPRLRLLWAPPWSGPASLVNRAIHHCHGAWVGLIGQHDQLDATAVAEWTSVADTIDIVLADDDALDEQGLRHSPRLGTAWDPDRVIASGCPGTILIRRTVLREVGGMRPMQGLEEWDLLLRAAAAKPDIKIEHLPSILLSRRQTAVPHGTHPAHAAAARRYLNAVGHGGATVHPDNGILRVVYPLPKTPPLTSVIIPTRDRADLMRACMAGLLQRTDYPNLEILIIDNGTTAPDAVALLQDLSLDPRVRVLPQPGPFNWSGLNNFGVSQMRGEVALLLNNDTEVIDPAWLREMVSQALRPEVGVVGAKLLYADRTVQHAGVVLGPAGRATHMWRHASDASRGYLDLLVSPRQVTVVTGACLAVRRKVYQAVGGCDAEGLPVTWNDSDLCLRIRAYGLRAIWSPYIQMLHLEQATRGSDETPERQIRFARERTRMRLRWGGALDADPFLNPNLLPSEANPQPHLAVD